MHITLPHVDKNSQTYSWLIQLYGHQDDLTLVTSVM